MRGFILPAVALELSLNVTNAAGPAALPPPRERYDAVILAAAERARLDPAFVKAVVAAESQFNPRALSPAGARGLMQLMPATAEEMGVDADRLGEPRANVEAGTAYLAWLYQVLRARRRLPRRLRDAPAWARRRVLAAYHGGPRCLSRKDWPPATRAYVRRVGELRRSGACALRLRADLSGGSGGLSRRRG
ncbi:MAG: lytic transglycosylase domain-containing protein [Elusimicrobia bacterium]|nr:lytic transglycosylase domain-containing protein [Elusimicrobiota bacterium]